MRRLIVNADDFGLTSGVNRAIIEANRQGVVTSATLMANSRQFDEAAALAREAAAENRRLSVGCHVVLLDGEPLLPLQSVPSLLGQHTNGAGQFRSTTGEFAAAAMRGKIQPQDVEAEATAQMRRIQDAGITLSHFDSHKHAHMFPAVLRPLLRAARACGVTAARNPFGRVFPLPLAKLLGRSDLWTRFAEMSVLRRFASRFRAAVAEQGMRTPDGSVGVLVTGALDVELFTTIVTSLPEGTWEFVCHPGYNDAELDGVRTRLRQSRAAELRVLTSPEAKATLEQRGIELISYHEL